MLAGRYIRVNDARLVLSEIPCKSAREVRENRMELISLQKNLKKKRDKTSSYIFYQEGANVVVPVGDESSYIDTSIDCWQNDVKREIEDLEKEIEILKSKIPNGENLPIPEMVLTKTGRPALWNLSVRLTSSHQCVDFFHAPFYQKHNAGRGVHQTALHSAKKGTRFYSTLSTTQARYYGIGEITSIDEYTGDYTFEWVWSLKKQEGRAKVWTFK